MNTERYLVKQECTVIGTLFQVYDGWNAVAIGTPKYFKDEAERIATRMNLMELSK